jgi:glutaredoxin
MKAVIWSKYHCPYCDQAYKLLQSKGYEAVPTARTVPQIFLDGELVGGFNELRKKLTESI